MTAGSMPLPSSVISMLTCRPRGRRAAAAALGVLAGRGALLGRLDGVVDGVADQVGERVLRRLEDGAVELGLLALHLDADLLAAGVGEVAHDARHLAPDAVDGLHARLHDALLQLAGDEVQPLRGPHEVGVGPRRGVLHDLVAGEDELADERHERVEQVDVDADAAVGDAATPVVLGLQRSVDVGLPGAALRHQDLTELAVVAAEGLVEHGRQDVLRLGGTGPHERLAEALDLPGLGLGCGLRERGDLERGGVRQLDDVTGAGLQVVRRAIRSVWVGSALGPSRLDDASSPRTASTISSSAPVMSGVSTSSPSRSRDSRLSPTCATASRWP
jgi:hypothetical protein